MKIFETGFCLGWLSLLSDMMIMGKTTEVLGSSPGWGGGSYRNLEIYNMFLWITDYHIQCDVTVCNCFFTIALHIVKCMSLYVDIQSIMQL